MPPRDSAGAAVPLAGGERGAGEGVALEGRGREAIPLPPRGGLWKVTCPKSCSIRKPARTPLPNPLLANRWSMSIRLVWLPCSCSRDGSESQEPTGSGLEQALQHRPWTCVQVRLGAGSGNRMPRRRAKKRAIEAHATLRCFPAVHQKYKVKPGALPERPGVGPMSKCQRWLAARTPSSKKACSMTSGAAAPQRMSENTWGWRPSCLVWVPGFVKPVQHTLGMGQAPSLLA